jgi:hypothetical protein
MKYFYNANWETSFAKYSGFALRKNIMGVHSLADKYGCLTFQDTLSKVYPPPPKAATKPQTMVMDQMATLIESHYSACFGEVCSVGEALVQEMLMVNCQLMRERGTFLVMKYPRLARDIILVTARVSNGDAHKWRPIKCDCATKSPHYFCAWARN